ncbi:MAG: O-antigen ligase family protein [Mariniblastus sp.]|nr:O-antigen ligase family protein [Mariniblastus sp.]
MTSPNQLTLQGMAEPPSRRRSGWKDLSWSDRFSWAARIVLLAAIVVSPWMIASVQFGPQYFLSLALLLGLGLWWFDTALQKKKSQVVPYLAVLVALGIGIGLLQVTALSDSVAHLLLGRQAELYADFGTLDGTAKAGTSGVAGGKRISLDTEQTWQMLRLLVMATCALMLGCRYFRQRSHLLLFLAVMTINGVAISFFGIVQKLTFNGMLFWQIPLTQGGAPFGPFVNRNNAGGYLLICFACALGLFALLMLQRRTDGPVPIISKEIPIWRQFKQQFLYFVSQLTAGKLAALLGIVFIAVGIISSLSRGAVLGLFAGVVVTLLFYGMARRPKNISVLMVPLMAAIIALSTWIGFSEELVSRFEKINVGNMSNNNLRFRNWQDTWQSVGEMGWFGSGMGSYHAVHRLYRNDLEDRIFTHAENQYFQTLVEMGWPGLVIYLAAWALAIYCALLLLFRGKTPSTIAAGVTGIFVIGSQAFASFFDFGLYIPANMLAAAAVMGVVGYQAQSMPKRHKFKSWIGWRLPNFAVSLVLVVLFGATTAVSLDLYRRWVTQSIIRQPYVEDRWGLPEVGDLNERITRLAAVMRRSPSVKGANHLANLWVEKSKVDFCNAMANLEQVSQMQDENKREWIQQQYASSSPAHIHERLQRLYDRSDLSAKRFIGNEFIGKYYEIARAWYETSKQFSPIQPEVHMRLGEINAVIDSPFPRNLDEVNLPNDDFERATRLAPSNIRNRLQAALFYLRFGDVDLAASHLKQYLLLDPDRYKFVVRLLDNRTIHAVRQFDNEAGRLVLDEVGRPVRRVQPVSSQKVVEEILPDDPAMLYQFTVDRLEEEPDLRMQTLDRADALLADATISQRDRLILKGRVRLEMGLFEEAIELLTLAVRSIPADDETRFILAQAQLRYGAFADAKENAERIMRGDSRNPKYKALLKQVNLAILNEQQ